MKLGIKKYIIYLIIITLSSCHKNVNPKYYALLKEKESISLKEKKDNDFISLKNDNKKIKVKDGDGFVIIDDKSIIDKVEIRLFGIDAPEIKQKCKDSKGNEYYCGEEAKDELKDLVKDGITCKNKGDGRYGRILAKCYTPENVDISAEMVKRGYAIAYRRYSTEYLKEEIKAKNDQVGIWKGGFEEPEEYRRNPNKKKRK